MKPPRKGTAQYPRSYHCLWSSLFAAQFSVRNRREAELLLKVSKSAASLDLFMKNYEMIASRAQGLQEAWKGLWLAQESYTVPAIPLIGLEMSGINRGRALLLEKMEREIISLQEHEKQLGHYIDVNSSLVEELRMEGIERLAMNKLLLVEVERELARRITHVCSSKGVHDLSSMRQFLCHLQKPTSALRVTVVENNQSRDHTESATNGSCSTEKVTDGFSDAHRSMNNGSEHMDTVSPDSQSIASKCAAQTTQADNICPPPASRPGDLAQSSKMLFGASPGPAGALNVRLDARNHSSSASEERLPKLLMTGNGRNELFQVLMGDALKTQELFRDKSMEGAEQCDKLTSKDLVPQGGNFPLCSVNEKEKSITDFEMGSKLALTQELDKGDGSNSDIARLCCPGVMAQQASSAQLGLDQSFEKSQMDKTPDNALKTSELDSRNNNKRQHLEVVLSGGETVGGENSEARNLKRSILQTAAVTSAIKYVRTDSNKRSQPGSSHDSVLSSFSDRVPERDSENRASLFLLCSCAGRCSNVSLDTLSAMDFKPSFQDRCKECGCFVSQAFTQHKRYAQTGSHPETSHEQELADDRDPLTESPILATQ